MDGIIQPNTGRPTRDMSLFAKRDEPPVQGELRGPRGALHHSQSFTAPSSWHRQRQDLEASWAFPSVEGGSGRA